jgi:hypothetical protein
MVNLDEVDQQLADWQAKLASARDNLLALYDHPTYKRLENPVAPLTGETRAAVIPALNILNELFAQMGQLTDLVERAVRMRRAIGRFALTDRPARDIQNILEGTSIHLPPVLTPLEQRGLLSASEQAQAITPARLLEIMTKSFEAAKSTILTVDAAWARLDPTMSACEMKLTTLASMAKTMGSDAEAQVVIAMRQYESIKNNALSDPLSAARSMGDPMAKTLDNLRASMETAAQQTSNLRARLEKANATIAEIADGRARADSAAARCRQCLDRPNGLLASVSDKQMTELADWLASLKDCDKQGHLTALAKGLDRWEQLAVEYTAVQKNAVAINEGMLEALAELKGRMSALKIKAMSKKPANPAAFAQAEQLATECLNRPLVPLDTAIKLVSDYERQLG